MRYFLLFAAWTIIYVVPQAQIAERYLGEPEDCYNGVDDDGDGWIDFFDTDCPEIESLYMAQPDVWCNSPSRYQRLDVKRKWAFSQPEVNLDKYQLIAGDIDSDNEVEIISLGFHNGTVKLLVLNGSTGLLENETSLGISGSSLQACMADINGDGYTEIFVVSANECLVAAFNYQLNPIWTTSFNCPEYFYVIAPNIADINSDGLSELYIGGLVFNAHNGEKLTSHHISHSHAVAIAGDFLPNYPGLEIASGNSVFFYIINNLNGSAGNFSSRKTIPTGHQGLTSAADIDGDEKLDVIFAYEDVSRNESTIIAWNPRNERILARATLTGSNHGSLYCGDIDNDCEIEIAIATPFKIKVFDYDGSRDLKLQYEITTSDESGRTGITAFDFNRDGLLELIIRDETHIQFINGQNGAEVLSYPINGRTWHETPIIVDVDDDPEAEMIVNGYDSNTEQDQILVLESNRLPWARARSVWNQTSYHTTNVNDNLTIPTNQQNHCIKRDTFCDCPSPYNAFPSQAAYRSRRGCFINPAFDCDPEILDVQCLGDSIIISYQLSNFADVGKIPEGFMIGVFDNNPLTTVANMLQSDTLLSEVLPNGVSPTMRLKIAKPNTNGWFYLYSNVNSNQRTPIDPLSSNLKECSYWNNLDSFNLYQIQEPINLGPDISICSTEISILQAPLGYQTYLWSDGSDAEQLETNDIGQHWVVVTDFCGQQTTDTVEITQNPGQQVEIIADSTVCEGDVALLRAPGPFRNYQWNGINNVLCDTCSEFYLLVKDDVSVILNVVNEQNCISSDTMHILALDTVLQIFSYEICADDSISLGGEWLSEAGDYVYSESSANFCDSTVIFRISQYDFNSYLDYEVNCEDQNVKVQLHAGEDLSILWPDLSSETEYLSPGGEDITVQLSNDLLGCTTHLQLSTPNMPDAPLLPGGQSISALEGEQIDFDLELAPEDWSVTWFPEEAFSCSNCIETILLYELDTIWVEFLHLESGCNEELGIEVFWKKVEVFIPNAFSPNGDGYNDLWQFYYQENIEKVHSVEVYNRWGDQVVTWEGNGKFIWDGTFLGQQAEPGVYIYSISFLTEQGNMIQKQGDLTLLR